MAEISVKELAKMVRTTPDRLLEQLNEAGVSVKHFDQMISDAEKRQLLFFLRSGKSNETVGKKKITLNKRKANGFVKQGKKSVSVEIRKKRKIIEDSPKDEVTEMHRVDAVIKTPVVENSIPGKVVEIKTSEILLKKNEKKVLDEGIDKSKKSRKDSRTHRHERTYKEREELPFQDRSSQSKKKVSRVKKRQSTAVNIDHRFEKPTEPVVREVSIPESITVADLAQKLSVKATELIKFMMDMGAMVTINQVLDQDTATLVVAEMGHRPNQIKSNLVEEILHVHQEGQVKAELVPRGPVVTIMGHVDHGKTSLLDYIRCTRITSGEAGGITQHIGAYHLDLDKGMITFLDTPGHEAFTAMRARGAKCTDIVVLVVSADDGVMPQTIEAIQHAKAADVPLIVAVNKIDKPEADPDRVKTELGRHDIIPEDWGGDTIFQNISAKTGEGIDDLLDSILLQAEVLELKAISVGPARGTVIESRLDMRRGPVATVLVTQGILNKGDIVLAGGEYGRLRAMIGDDGKHKSEAGPSVPVEILGLAGAPEAGDDLVVINDEKKAREISNFRQGQYREVRLAKKQTTHLENIFDQIGKKSEKLILNIVLKVDVQGSLEAISKALHQLSTDQVKVNIVSSAVGGITASDANLALVSKAIIIGFNVRADQASKIIVEKEGIELYYYSVIYDVIDEVKKALSGLLVPEIQEKIVGLSEVRRVFRSSKLGLIAGCMVIDGCVKRNLPIRVLRDNVVIYEGQLESLKRFKEDVSEVRNSMECGIGVKHYNDIAVGDQIECYEKVTVKCSL